MQHDNARIRRLARWHFLLAGLIGFVGSIPTIHAALGVLLVLGVIRPDTAPGDYQAQLDAGRTSGMLLIMQAGAAIAVAWTVALLILAAAKRLAADRCDGFCRAVAWLECLAVPLGTILGLVTLRTMARETKQS